VSAWRAEEVLMAAPRRLNPADIEAAVRSLPGWTSREGKLHKEFKFKTFVEAFGFMTQIALVAESKNHHPEWFNVYNRVKIDLTTHEVGGVSERDIDLAGRIDAIAATMPMRS
jgi:4a-hydroxytetrahydrobiopterin dehydratase